MVTDDGIPAHWNPDNHPDDYYTKLAAAAVRAGVGRFNNQTGKYYPVGAPKHQNFVGYMTAEAFIKDGRTVLALMEKCRDHAYAFGIGYDFKDKEWYAHFSDIHSEHESLAVALAEAYLRALGEIE